jgi:hypothetical protein
MKSWVIYIAAALGFAIYGAATNVDRDETGAIVGGGTVDAFNVQVGDCFNDAHLFDDESFDDELFDDEISSVPGVPCSEPHDNEAFAVFDVSIENYLDEDAMYELAYDSCMTHFESFVGKDYESSTLEITTMYPTAESWNQNDHEVVCAVFDMNADQLVGSAAGRGL